MTGSSAKYRGVILNVSYEDGNAAIDWLTRVLGVRERSRYVDKDGNVMQAELFLGDHPLWIDGHGPGYWEQKGRRPDQYLLVLVDDVDAHYERARVAGAEIARTPADQDYGMRTYVVTDPEGWSWCFMQDLGTPYRQRIPTEEGGWEEILADSGD